MRRQRGRGVSLLEATATTLLIGMALTLSTGLSFRWRDLNRRLDDQARAQQFLASEMDGVLGASRGRLKAGVTEFPSKTMETCGLEKAKGHRRITSEEGGAILRVTLALAWGEDAHAEREVLLGAKR